MQWVKLIALVFVLMMVSSAAQDPLPWWRSGAANVSWFILGVLAAPLLAK